MITKLEHLISSNNFMDNLLGNSFKSMKNLQRDKWVGKGNS